MMFFTEQPCRVGSVGSVFASRTVGHEFASRPGHTKDHYKNGTNCLPACLKGRVMCGTVYALKISPGIIRNSRVS